MGKKLLFVVNVDWFFVSHRLPIAQEALRQGYEVHIATGITTRQEELQQCGLIVHPLTLDRSKVSLIDALRTFWQMMAVFVKIQPDLVHLVTIKPVFYGGLVARLTRVPAVVVAFAGLGTVFVAPQKGFGFRRRIVEAAYRVALGHPNLKAIFQNPDDRSMLISLGALHDSKAVLIRGSGVALRHYPLRPELDGVPVVTFAARLLKDKGLPEFIDSIRILKGRGVVARFWLVGTTDPGNPSSVSEADVQEWVSEELVVAFGHRSDIADVFSASHVVVLPSYREGLPKVLIEAAACGRAVVTTDVPGCRDAIESGITGLLVPVRDALALADAIASLIQDPQRRRQMGAAGRRLAEQAFTIDRVVETHMLVYAELLKNRSGKHA